MDIHAVYKSIYSRPGNTSDSCYETLNSYEFY